MVDIFLNKIFFTKMFRFVLSWRQWFPLSHCNFAGLESLQFLLAWIPHRWCQWWKLLKLTTALLWDTDWVEKNGAILSLLLVRAYYIKIGWKVVKWSFNVNIKTSVHNVTASNTRIKHQCKMLVITLWMKHMMLP